MEDRRIAGSAVLGDSQGTRLGDSQSAVLGTSQGARLSEEPRGELSAFPSTATGAAPPNDLPPQKRLGCDCLRNHTRALR